MGEAVVEVGFFFVSIINLNINTLNIKINNS